MNTDDITTTEAATLLGVSKKTVYRLIDAGTIEASKPFGNRVGHKVSRAVVENFRKRRWIETSNRRRAAK